jgi:hypothetical protein
LEFPLKVKRSSNWNKIKLSTILTSIPFTSLHFQSTNQSEKAVYCDGSRIQPNNSKPLRTRWHVIWLTWYEMAVCGQSRWKQWESDPIQQETIRDKFTPLKNIVRELQMLKQGKKKIQFWFVPKNWKGKGKFNKMR